MFKVGVQIKGRSIDITPTKDIHLPTGTTTAFDLEMVKKSSDLSDGPVVMRMKSQGEDWLPEILKVALVNSKFI